jgi:hypothetical protein
MSVSAQTTQGLISGYVLDQGTGNAIRGAVIEYENSATQERGARTADASGYFALPLLSPGMYRLRAEAAQYQPREYYELRLPVAGVLRVDFELRPSAEVLDQALAGGLYFPQARTLVDFYGPDVNPGYALLVISPDTREGRLESTVSETISPQQIQDLPLVQRDAYAALVLLPGVNADTATGRGIGVSVNGQRPSASNFLFDGMENNNYLTTGPLAVLVPEAIQEYRVSINNFSAEYGRSAGYLANAVTKAGTNQWHALGYYYLNHEKLNANDFARNAEGLGRGIARRNEPGVQGGGPLLSGRLFASAAVNYARHRGRGDPVEFYLPSSQFMRILNSYPADNQARQLLAAYPPPAASSPSGYDFAPVRTQPPVAEDQWVSLGRVDYLEHGGRSRWVGRVAILRSSRPDFIWSPYVGFSSTFVQDSASMTVSNQRVLSIGVTNDFRGAIGNQRISFDRPHPEVPSFGVSPDNGNPDLVKTPVVVLPGSLAAYAYQNHGVNGEIAENLIWIYGRHVWKLGGGFLLRSVSGYLTYGRDGEFVFQNFTAFENDLAPQYVFAGLSRQALSASGGQNRLTPDYNRNYNYRQFHAYLQDSSRVTSRLTLNYGFRYENFGVPVNSGAAKDPLIQLGAGANLGDRLSGAQLVYPAADEPLYDADHSNWNVRLGVAYSLFANGSTVLRGAYGTFHDRPFDNLWQTMANNASVLATFRPTGPVPYLSQPLSQSIQRLPMLEIPNSGSLLTMYQPGMRDALVHSYFAGIQQRVSQSWMLEVDGLGSLGRKLIATDIVNRSSELRADLPEIYYRGNQADSNYTALAIVGRYTSGRTQLQAAYTWGHTIDNQSDPLSGEYFDFQFFRFSSAAAPLRATFSRQFDSRADRGSADFDQRHNLVFTGTWQTRGAFSSQWMSWLSQHWRISALGAIRSGMPYSVVGADAGDLINVRADLTVPASAAKLSTPTQGGRILLDSKAFMSAAAGELGNTGRNAFSGPGFLNIDLAVARAFPLRRLGESANLTVRAEAYNIFNHANLGNPDSYLGSPTFGVATFGRQEAATGQPSVFPLRETAREVQLLVRFQF